MTSVCFDPDGDGLHNAPCGNPDEGPFVTVAECQAAGGLFCAPNSAFVMTCCDPVSAVSRATQNFTWGSAPGPSSPGGGGGRRHGPLRRHAGSGRADRRKRHL